MKKLTLNILQRIMLVSMLDQIEGIPSVQRVLDRIGARLDFSEEEKERAGIVLKTDEGVAKYEWKESFDLEITLPSDEWIRLKNSIENFGKFKRGDLKSWLQPILDQMEIV